jgi:thymidylate synthase
MNNLDYMSIEDQYLSLINKILRKGVEKKDRTGTGTISIFGAQIRHDMSKGFPILTTKKMAWKTLKTELLWFLKGDTNIKFLVENGCNIWNGDAYKNYKVKNLYATDIDYITMDEFKDSIKNDEEFGKLYGELGPVYGSQWRKWKTFRSDNPEAKKKPSDSVQYFDQIKILIDNLKNNPDSRRLMVNAWNVGELERMVLPPCHYGFQLYTQELTLDERIEFYNRSVNPMARSTDYFEEHMDFYGVPKRSLSLMWNQRSVDTFLGLPFNIASYGLLLEIIAREVNMVPKELIGNLGDVHLYNDHLDQAKEQTTRDPFKLPKLKYKNKIDIDNIIKEDIEKFELINYNFHPSIKANLSN